MTRSGTDTNGVVAALLRDLAAVQKNTQSSWGYKRAAAAVLALEEPIESFVEPDGTLRKIPNIGPKSARVILEVLKSGSSPSVEQAVVESGKVADVDKRRGLRSNFLSRAQVMAALNDPTLTGPSLADYHGDFQMHSVWSDGSQTLEEIIVGCLERDYQFCAITDHSHGLKVAGGMTMAEVEEQHAEIDQLNRAYSGRFRMLKGIEANITAAGGVDLSGPELAKFELVVAAPHAALRLTEDQTARMVAAVETPGVKILGHPRGRMYGTRAGVLADWDAVFAAAARAGVAVEIDGDPSRQDIDHTLAPRALQAGCLFALDSDAHSTPELAYAETAVAHARLAGVPRDRVVNCWPLERLLQWLGLGVRV
jgi:putative hydrolase